jgi:hypothetical protein
LALLVLTVPTASAADKWWVGGALGVSFGGNVDFVSLEPAAGYWINPKLTVGGRLIFRYRKDKRLDDEGRTDYGASVLTRYFVIKNVFVQGEYEYLSYEVPGTGGSTERDGYGSLLGGAGYSVRMTRNSSFHVLGLYNFTWDEDEMSPYAEPWILRLGVGFRF